MTPPISESEMRAFLEKDSRNYFQPIDEFDEEIKTKIYEECGKSRAVPEWVYNDQEQIIGWIKVSIDSWCE